MHACMHAYIHTYIHTPSPIALPDDLQARPVGVIDITCYTILCYAILYYTILYYTILYYTITILYHIVYHTTLYSTILTSPSYMLWPGRGSENFSPTVAFLWSMVYGLGSMGPGLQSTVCSPTIVYSLESILYHSPVDDEAHVLHLVRQLERAARVVPVSPT